MSRLAGLEGERFDVALIGGGIIGCGIARDAAMRGLRVVLIEKGDFGGGTTSASTRIVHGGLRYLEMLDLRLVRLDLRERETLLRIAGHLIKPLEFLVPLFRDGGVSALKMRAGLAIYDALSFDKTLPSRRWLARQEARRGDRVLDRDDLNGVAAYHDARIDSPERLSIENVIDAATHHAIPLNHCEVISSVRSHGRVVGVRVRDLLSGEEVNLVSRVVVNATGAWFDPVNQLLCSRASNLIRMTKGIHIVCPPLTSHAMVLFSGVDKRLMFAIPRAGLTWIGTTDTDFDGDPEGAAATAEDVEYVLASVRGLFPRLALSDVLFTTAGVRALVRRPGRASSISRMHRIVDGPPVSMDGVISVLGGKITGYRAIAEQATDAICRRLRATDRPSRTAQVPLPGASGRIGALRTTLDSSTVGHLADLYGSRAAEVAEIAHANPSFAQPLNPAYPDIGAQVVHAVRREHARRLSDFIRRRSLLGASADQGLAAADAVARLMAAELGWSERDLTTQVGAYREDIERTHTFNRPR